MLRRLKHQRGLTLIEVMSSLAVLAVVIGGALSLYTSASARQTTTQTLTDISAIRATVKALHVGQGGYGAMGTNLIPVVFASKGVPATMTGTATSIGTSWGGYVLITGYGAGFDIVLSSISLDQCVGLLSSTSANWRVKRSGAGGTYYTDTQVSPATALTACTANTDGLIYFSSL